MYSFRPNADEPIPAEEPRDGLSAHATGTEGVSGKATARSRWSNRVNDRPEELPQENLSLYEPLSNSDSKPQPNIFPTCWILILIVLTVVFGSAAIGIYYSTKHQMGDGFTTASWVVAVGTLLLAGPIAYHYPHCGCWKPQDSTIRSCWILIFCGSGFFLTSGAIGLAFSVSGNRMGDGFSAAGWVLAVGCLALAGPTGYHYPHCRCWKKGERQSFQAPQRVRTVDFLRRSD